MLIYEKQALFEAIEVLSQAELPTRLEGTMLYGSPEEVEDELRQDCKIFKLSNETGHGKIAVYQIFPGVELYYNDIHMGYCNQNEVTARNGIEINHCRIGRFECSFGENSCCYMTEGDLSITAMRKKKSSSCFPLNHYHGISIIIDLDEILPEVQKLMELLNIDLHYIQRYICEGNRCCIMRANPSIEHIFSELYHVREKRKLGYMKIKILELLLFLSDLNTAEEALQTDYFNQNQVTLIKAVASYITEDLTIHHTIEQLSQKFEISTTALKNIFGVFMELLFIPISEPIVFRSLKKCCWKQICRLPRLQVKSDMKIQINSLPLLRKCMEVLRQNSERVSVWIENGLYGVVRRSELH